MSLSKLSFCLLMLSFFIRLFIVEISGLDVLGDCDLHSSGDDIWLVITAILSSCVGIWFGSNCDLLSSGGIWLGICGEWTGEELTGNLKWNLVNHINLAITSVTNNMS